MVDARLEQRLENYATNRQEDSPFPSIRNLSLQPSQPSNNHPSANQTPPVQIAPHQPSEQYVSAPPPGPKLRAEEVGSFDPEYKQEQGSNGPVVNVGKHVFHKDVFMFTNRLKDLAVQKGEADPKAVITSCFRGAALVWYSMESTELERDLLRDADMNHFIAVRDNMVATPYRAQYHSGRFRSQTSAFIPRTTNQPPHQIRSSTSYPLLTRVPTRVHQAILSVGHPLLHSPRIQLQSRFQAFQQTEQPTPKPCSLQLSMRHLTSTSAHCKPLRNPVHRLRQQRKRRTKSHGHGYNIRRLWGTFQRARQRRSPSPSTAAARLVAASPTSSAPSPRSHGRAPYQRAEIQSSTTNTSLSHPRCRHEASWPGGHGCFLLLWACCHDMRQTGGGHFVGTSFY